MTEIEQDVLSALINLGCQRPAAEMAIRSSVVIYAVDTVSQRLEMAQIKGCVERHC